MQRECTRIDEDAEGTADVNYIAQLGPESGRRNMEMKMTNDEDEGREIL